MGFVMWGAAASAAGAAALATGGITNIKFALIGAALAVAALVGTIAWRVGRFDRDRDLPKD